MNLLLTQTHTFTIQSNEWWSNLIPDSGSHIDDDDNPFKYNPVLYFDNILMMTAKEKERYGLYKLIVFQGFSS